MSDFLAYRLPGKEVVQKKGNFRLKTPPYPEEGFVVSDFLKKEMYFFEEDPEAESNFYFKQKPPYIASKKEYLIGAETLLNSFHLFSLSKAVYARVKSTPFNVDKTEELFRALESKYPKAFVYVISSRLFGTWIGATPELLLSMHGKEGYTMSLAGTKQKLQAVEHEWNQKELVEQNLVTEYIQKKLELMNLKEVETHGPFEMVAGPVKHLRTDFSFHSPDKKALDIASNLHPTPAIAGVPTKEALDMITTVEHNPRLLYTGFIGELGSEHSNLFVNLRCCQIQDGKAYLYVGGGYTKDSLPEDEWYETENKARTLLDIIKQTLA
ncbi:MAG: chorismate-binding protein [Crocinitomicaceae bacterium]|jgi:isochorismate synthase|nr:chorismate-binding protein [Crocinitomicaceae bacterium]